MRTGMATPISETKMQPSIKIARNKEKIKDALGKENIVQEL